MGVLACFVVRRQAGKSAQCSVGTGGARERGAAAAGLPLIALLAAAASFLEEGKEKGKAKIPVESVTMNNK